MIDDVDQTIAALLRSELPEATVKQVAITFDTPDEHFSTTASLPALNFFLYDIRENLQLRSGEWDVAPADANKLRRTRGPIRIDCSYLVTAWPSTASTRRSLDEHWMLGVTLAALLRNPVLPASVLQGALALDEHPTPTATLQRERLDDVGAFWQAMGGRPRAVFGYTVTIAAQIFASPDGVPVITDRVLDLEQTS